MSKGNVYSLLFAVLASLSISAFAAEPPKVEASKPKPAVTQAAEVDKVDLNTADADTLQRQLIGIGEVKAKAIVAHRETNGPFTSVDELLEVKGIGAATLEKNRDKLSLK